MKTLNIGNVFIVRKWMWRSATLNATWYVRAKIFNKFFLWLKKHSTILIYYLWMHFICAVLCGVAPHCGRTRARAHARQRPNSQYTELFSRNGHFTEWWREQCRLHWIRSSWWNWKWYLNVSNIPFPHCPLLWNVVSCSYVAKYIYDKTYTHIQTMQDSIENI